MTIWSRLGFDPTLARDWPDGTVLFNRLSGETHVLSPLATSALALIEREPSSTVGLLAALMREHPDTDRVALETELNDLLREMERLGIVACTRS